MFDCSCARIQRKQGKTYTLPNHSFFWRKKAKMYTCGRPSICESMLSLAGNVCLLSIAADRCGMSLPRLSWVQKFPSRDRTKYRWQPGAEQHGCKVRGQLFMRPTPLDLRVMLLGAIVLPSALWGLESPGPLEHPAPALGSTPAQHAGAHVGIASAAI